MSDPVWLPWAARVVWLTLPLTAGGVVFDDLDGRSAAVGVIGSILWWAAWGCGVLAVLLPRPAGLTCVRLVAPALAGAAAFVADSGGDWAATGAAVALAALTFLPEVGAWLVNGAAYGYERRYLLRAPGPLLLGPIPMAAVVAVLGATAGPLLLAAEQWLAGGALTLVGGAAAVVTARALHLLTQRWAVLVPAGLVLKDHTTTVDPVLFRRGEIEWFGPAPADTDALDLTSSAPGLALELRVSEPAPLALVDRRGRTSETVRARRVLFTPTRPGAVLADAGNRRIRVVT